MKDMKFKKNKNKVKWVIPGYGLIPIIKLIIFGVTYRKYILIELLIYILLGILVYKTMTKTIAEIKNGILHIYSGIGLNDPSEIPVDKIVRVERLSKKLLKIKYDKTEETSMEAYPVVIDQIEDYFKSKK